MIKISRQDKKSVRRKKKLGGKRQKCNGGSCNRERNKNEARQKRQIETMPEGGEKVNPRRHGYCRKNAQCSGEVHEKLRWGRYKHKYLRKWARKGRARLSTAEFQTKTSIRRTYRRSTRPPPDAQFSLNWRELLGTGVPLRPSALVAASGVANSTKQYPALLGGESSVSQVIMHII